MSPYRPEITKIVTERENLEQITALRRFIETTSAEYRNDGVPLDSEGRIDTLAFKDVYTDTGKDSAAVEQRFKEWYPGIPQSEISERKMLSDGEQLEMLIYAILQKNLGREFVVARSSHHDDHVNHVDQVLLERRTGSVVCAFDEVGDTTGPEYERKVAEVRNRNVNRAGANVKYGLGLRESDGKIIPAEIHNVPVFYIALAKDLIKKGLKDFVPNTTQQSDFEKKLFEYFVAAISLQIKGLELHGQKLNSDLRKRLEAFSRVVASANRKAK
jgi:hypothetical protein